MEMIPWHKRTVTSSTLIGSSAISFCLIFIAGRVGGRVCGSCLDTAYGKDSWDVGGQWVARYQNSTVLLK